MTDTIKAKLAEISLGGQAIEGFMMPDGSYAMSQDQAANCIAQSKRNLSDFLRSKTIKSLLGKGYTSTKKQRIAIDVRQQRGGATINPLTIDEVGAYWVWQCYRGNKKALTLCMALISESLERRFDDAFGVERSEAERNNRLEQRLQTLEADMEKLGEAYATEDILRQELDYFRQVFQQLGIDPYALPKIERN